MATKYDQSSEQDPFDLHTSSSQVHFKYTSSALEMSSVNPPIVYRNPTWCFRDVLQNFSANN